MYQSGIDAVSERQKMTIKQYIRKVCQEKDEIGLESKFTFCCHLTKVNHLRQAVLHHH